MTVETNQEKKSFQAEVKQLLDIVVHSLYSNKEIFLRELVSNASDAIDKLRFEALSNSAYYENDPDMQIKISFDEKANTLTISDNGIGMSRDEAVAHLGTIAKSGTKEFLSQLTGDQKKDANLIGQFGVGFYSAFIVADNITVHSRRAGLEADFGVSWESKGDGEYVVENIHKETRGTDVILHLKEAEKEFLEDWRLRSIITKYSDHITVPIQMLKRIEEDDKKSDQEKLSTEWETVNRATALWALPKSKITEEEYNAFYKHIAHDFNDPLAYTHNKIEGSSIDYTALLYIPAEAPFDMWQRQAPHGLKLFVQRVFIMDQVEQFFPMYLRFIRGVLDTTALPLNISREILQDHPTIFKLKNALVRHVLDLLDKLAANDKEKYATFWKTFGNVLKEGPAEDFANRDRVAKLLRFTTTQSDTAEQTVSLEDYLSRMKEKQSKIYYITADTLSAAKASPHLEIFAKNNIEVLLLTDKIDEWVVSHLSEYQSKTLQSIAKGDLKLEEIITENEAEKKAEEAKEAEQLTQFDDVLKKMKEALSEKVKEVKLSHRLTNSPVCLVRDQNSLGVQMERLLKASGQAIPEVKPILEINAEHPILIELKKMSAGEQFNEWSTLLFDQALLAEGSQLPDPSLFIQRMNKLWMGTFG